MAYFQIDPTDPKIISLILHKTTLSPGQVQLLQRLVFASISFYFLAAKSGAKTAVGSSPYSVGRSLWRRVEALADGDCIRQ
jgi:hypothetical protein